MPRAEKIEELTVNFSTFCNFQCKECMRPFPKEKAFLAMGTEGKLDPKSVENLLSAIGKNTRVTITGGGEPTLHPFFHELVDAIANGKEKPREIVIVTNGTPFTTKGSTRDFLTRLKEVISGDTKFRVSMSIDDNHSYGTLGVYEKEGKWPERITAAQNFHCVARELGISHGFNSNLTRDQINAKYGKKIWKAIAPSRGEAGPSFDIWEILEGLPKERMHISKLTKETRKGILHTISESLHATPRNPRFSPLSTACVDATGEVYHNAPSYFFQNIVMEKTKGMEGPIGNIHHKPLLDLLTQHGSWSQRAKA